MAIALGGAFLAFGAAFEVARFGCARDSVARGTERFADALAGALRCLADRVAAMLRRYGSSFAR